MLRYKSFGRALADAARYLTVRGRLSRLYLRTRWRILRTRKTAHLGLFPPWLNEDFVRTMRLRERWETAVQQSPAPAGAVRPEAYEVTFAAFWPDLFNVLDPGVTGVPVEIRHPFFDLRLMNYLLALARLPWCSDKQLLREAGRGVLPDAVCLRRKSPLLADPLRKLVEMPEAAEINRFEPVPGLERFVNTSRIPQVSEQEALEDPWVHLRPLSLNYWLRGLGGSDINAKGGIKDELSIARRP